MLEMQSHLVTIILLVGYNAGSAIAAGVANTFIGQEAGLTTAAGGSNTAVGKLALTRLKALTQ